MRDLNPCLQCFFCFAALPPMFVKLSLHTTSTPSEPLTQTSGQDGGIGRYPLPPPTTQRRTTTNLKTKTTRTARKSNCMEVQQPRIKEETFIQTSRRSGDGQPGWRGLTARWQLADQVVPHLCAGKQGGTTGERERPRNPGLQCRKRKPQNL